MATQQKQQKEEDQEDFTFPTTTPPRFLGSPPLWQSTTSTSSLQKQPKKKQPINQEEETFSNSKPIIISNINRRKSLSYIDDYCSDDGDEKMDMLWEDLNEEYSKNCGLVPVPDSGGSPGSMVRFGCVKGGGKRPNMVVFVKVLKKLFVLHNSHRSIKKRSRFQTTLAAGHKISLQSLEFNLEISRSTLELNS
ncbi:hypothetical protein LguiB_018135 [Lonicera macranthoides]